MSFLSDEMINESNSLSQRLQQQRRMLSLNHENKLNDMPPMFKSIKQSVSNKMILKRKRKSFTTSEEDDNINNDDYIQQTNELCPLNEFNKFNSNIRKSLPKSSLSSLEQENSKYYTNKKPSKMYKKHHSIKRTSSKITNETYIVKNMNQLPMKRQEALSRLSLSSIENDLNTYHDDDISARRSNMIVQNDMCTSCIQKINCRVACEFCAQTQTIPSQVTMNSINQTDNQSYESWLNDTNILSSTPMITQSKQIKTSNPFNLLRNCIFTSTKRVKRTTTTMVKKEFKLESYTSEDGHKIKQLKVKRSLKNKIELNSVKRAKKMSSTRKYNLPRTSSFNSNCDDMDLNDFHSNNNNNQDNLLFDSVMPTSKTSQNFNNYGDFVVWYV